MSREVNEIQMKMEGPCSALLFLLLLLLLLLLLVTTILTIMMIWMFVIGGKTRIVGEYGCYG